MPTQFRCSYGYFRFYDSTQTAAMTPVMSVGGVVMIVGAGPTGVLAIRENLCNMHTLGVSRIHL